MTVHEQLEELQKKDWKELSIDEKKAGAFFDVGLVFGVWYVEELGGGM